MAGQSRKAPVTFQDRYALRYAQTKACVFFVPRPFIPFIVVSEAAASDLAAFLYYFPSLMRCTQGSLMLRMGLSNDSVPSLFLPVSGVDYSSFHCSAGTYRLGTSTGALLADANPNIIFYEDLSYQPIQQLNETTETI
ncbi:MAG: hypothetical protein EOP56_13600 [Sphingobacteriales bacterium]|nr:MAG: hypothetical protein EOP56_13600 [Sphingobacteriales bacterium]